MYAESPKVRTDCRPENAAPEEFKEVWPRYFPGETELAGDDPRAILVGDLVQVLQLEKRREFLPRVSACLFFPYIASFLSPLMAMRF